MSDDWDGHWQDHDSSNVINPAQIYRKRLIYELLEITENNNNVRLLDVGSGNGQLLSEVTADYPEILTVGLEYSSHGVKISKEKSPNSHFFQIDLTKTNNISPELGHWATHSVCSEVIEHVNEPRKFLINAGMFMGNNCRLIVTVPGGPISEFDRHIGHRKHYTVSELRELLESSGFHVDKVCGAGFPFFNLYRLLVLIRGKRLIADSNSQPGFLLKALSAFFNILMPMNLSNSKFGWQIVAICKKL